MKNISLLTLLCCLAACSLPLKFVQADRTTYLQPLLKELRKVWPDNRSVNLVFHGHSVPAGYFKTPAVQTLDAYPHQVLEGLKASYPTAVINVINTAIGGENSQSGAARFEKEVLCHRPDVLFIDYALNDRRLGLEDARKAWERMIQKALRRDVQVILLTPSPDQRTPLLETDTELARHAAQVRGLAEKYGLGLVDSYAQFQEQVKAGAALKDYMSQVNHPNRAGHALIAKEILRFFTNDQP